VEIAQRLVNGARKLPWSRWGTSARSLDGLAQQGVNVDEGVRNAGIAGSVDEGANLRQMGALLVEKKWSNEARVAQMGRI